MFSIENERPWGSDEDEEVDDEAEEEKDDEEQLESGDPQLLWEYFSKLHSAIWW